MSSVSIPIAMVLAASLVAVFTDVWRFKVYNALTFPVFLSAVAYHSATSGVSGIGFSLSGAAFAFGVLVVPYMLGALGAGDVKFVMAIGAWLGMSQVLPALIIGSLATGIYALVVITWTGGYRDAWFNLQLVVFRLRSFGKQFAAEDRVEAVQEAVVRSDRRRRLIPFSAMMSVGFAATILWQLFVEFR